MSEIENLRAEVTRLRLELAVVKMGRALDRVAYAIARPFQRVAEEWRRDSWEDGRSAAICHALSQRKPLLYRYDGYCERCDAVTPTYLYRENRSGILNLRVFLCLSCHDKARGVTREF